MPFIHLIKTFQLLKHWKKNHHWLCYLKRILVSNLLLIHQPDISQPGNPKSILLFNSRSIKGNVKVVPIFRLNVCYPAPSVKFMHRPTPRSVSKAALQSSSRRKKKYVKRQTSSETDGSAVTGLYWAPMSQWHHRGHNELQKGKWKPVGTQMSHASKQSNEDIYSEIKIHHKTK